MNADPVLALYVGTVGPMPGDGRPTAIHKQPVLGPLMLDAEGLAGDQHGDPRVHGGPDKALHQYPRDHYRRLAAAFPDLAVRLVPGAMGENLSTATADADRVCIGDVFGLGAARIQLCQPRRPCWKIDARFDVEGLSVFVAAHGLTGWYYRVLRPGRVAVGDTLELVERQSGALTVEQFLNLNRAHRPQVVDLLRAAALTGLPAAWAERLRNRARWLHDHTVAPIPLADDP